MCFILAHIVILILWLWFSVPLGEMLKTRIALITQPSWVYLSLSQMGPALGNMHILWEVSILGSWSSYLYNDIRVELRKVVDEYCRSWCPWFYQAPHGSQNPSWVRHTPQDVRCLQAKHFPANSKRQWSQLCHQGGMLGAWSNPGEEPPLSLISHDLCWGSRAPQVPLHVMLPGHRD